MDSEDVFLVTASMNNETVFRAEINLNGENDFYVDRCMYIHVYNQFLSSGTNLDWFFSKF